MKVFVLINNYGYNLGSYPCGVASTEAAADAWMAKDSAFREYEEYDVDAIDE